MSDCNKKRTLKIEDGTAIPSKRERHIDTTTIGKEDIDIEAVANSWSQNGAPQRLKLNRAEEMKVSSLEDGNLRGGNFVLDCDGKAATLSFAFEVNGSMYGLTTGHLADVSDSIFCFFLNSKTPNNFDSGGSSSSYEVLELGVVVSKNVETDSLIFEITNPYMVGRVDLFPQAGLCSRSLRLPQPDFNPMPPRSDTKVTVCFTVL